MDFPLIQKYFYKIRMVLTIEVLMIHLPYHFESAKPRYIHTIAFQMATYCDI